MKSPTLKFAATLPLLVGFAGLAAAADQIKQCDVGTLNGLYVFTASGFTRPPASVPGTAWTPKSILELLNFNGDGTLTSPGVILANPFGDLGNIVFDDKGVARINFTVGDISVSKDAANGIIGRAVIVHAAVDDLATDPTGNAGARVACGVIQAG